MFPFDWQLAVALACVAGALVVIARRVRELFGGNPGRGCGTKSCGGCSAPPTLVKLGEQKTFVSLESLEHARHNGPDFTHAVKSGDRSIIDDR